MKVWNELIVWLLEKRGDAFKVLEHLRNERGESMEGLQCSFRWCVEMGFIYSSISIKSSILYRTWNGTQTMRYALLRMIRFLRFYNDTHFIGLILTNWFSFSPTFDAHFIADTNPFDTCCFLSECRHRTPFALNGQSHKSLNVFLLFDLRGRVRLQRIGAGYSTIPVVNYSL